MTHGALHQRRVLVTGGGGFLGRAVCRAVGRAGAAQVHTLHRRPVADGRPAEPSGGGPDVVRWQADLTDPDAVRRVVRAARPDVVLHAAGFASAARDLAAVGPAVRDNLLACTTLLSVAAEAGVGRVVVAGSTESPAGVGDVAAVTPNSPYAASKHAEACFARTFHRAFGLDVVVARLSVIYGPGDRRPAKLVPHIATRLLAGRPADLSSGRRRIDWVYVDDAADGMVACAAGGPELAGRTVDVGTGRLTSVANVAAELARLTGRPDLLRLGALPDRPDEVEATADAAATERLTGWRARTPLADGLAATVRWLREPDPPGGAATDATGARATP